MAELKFKVPEEVKKEVEESPEFNWSEFVARAIESKAFELELERSKKLRRAILEFLTSKSKLTEEDALELGRKIKEGRFEELKAQGLVWESEIEFVPLDEYVKFFESAMHLSVDPDDIDFFALSLRYDRLPIWSNDEHFKMQTEIEVFTTLELLKELGLK